MWYSVYRGKVMYFFLIMIATIFILRFLLPPPSSTGYTGKNKKTWCPLHEYVYDSNDVMKCKRCDKTPEQIVKEL